jgi:hypothetical protein
VCRDYQQIKIQEQVSRLSVGSLPRTMSLVLQDDLGEMAAKMNFFAEPLSLSTLLFDYYPLAANDRRAHLRMHVHACSLTCRPHLRS